MLDKAEYFRIIRNARRISTFCDGRLGQNVGESIIGSGSLAEYFAVSA
jgi:hypothetical protein